MRRAHPDRSLIQRLAGGDQSAFGALDQTYRRKIYQLALRYMKNPEDAEEVTQDVLLRVVDKIDTFRGDAALSSWIYRITFNTAMSRLRSAKFSRPFEVAHGDLGPTPDRLETPHPKIEGADWSSLADDAVHRAELRRRLVSALASLPAIYRTPVVLRDIQGMSTGEASALLGLKPQTLKSRLHRGRMALREQLGEFAEGLSLHHPAA